MKKTLAAATVAALFGVVGAANAADFGGLLKDAPVFVPPPTWAGFYIGGHVGGAWGELQNSWDFYLDTWRIGGARWTNDNDALFGGGTVGYNYQTGAFVFGLETDFGGIGLSGTTRNDAFYSQQNGSFYADVTGRLGYALGPALLYAKGGWAYLDNPITVGFYDYFGTNHTFNGESLSGWTVGGGLEYQFSPSWSVKGEYQYFDFGEQTYPYVFNDVEHQLQSAALTLSTFKVGLNYRFGNIYAPLK